MSGTKGHSGGKRAGAGRKPAAPGTPAVRRSVTLSVEADLIVARAKRAERDYSATLDRIVREWAQGRG